MKLSSNEKKFIQHVKKIGKIYNIKCYLRNRKYLIADNVKCAGWFDENENCLVVATNRPDWLETLVHEYCHLTQFIENDEIWQKGNSSCISIGDWLLGKKIKNIKKHLDNVKMLELDNEKRAIRVIKTFNLNINVKNYIKKANAYIHFYNWLKENNEWPLRKKAPYDNKRIISAMSDKFNMDYKKLSPRIRKIFLQETI